MKVSASSVDGERGPGWRGALRDLAAECLEALYPRLCLLCREAPRAPLGMPGAPGDRDLGCESHGLFVDLDRGPPGAHCPRCARRLPPVLPDQVLCAACRGGPPPWSRLVTLADYGPGEPIRDWVLAMKHGGRRDLGPPLGRLLGRRLRAVLDHEGPRRARSPPLLLPVPVHALRRLERGHDQAELLARGVAESTAGELCPGLVRQRDTAPQGSPGSVSRRANVDGAFVLSTRARTRVAGRDVWLVDDVVTSGATLAACRAALSGAGFRSVAGLALARVLEERPGRAQGLSQDGAQPEVDGL